MKNFIQIKSSKKGMSNAAQYAFIPTHIAPGVYINVVAPPIANAAFPQRYNALFFIASDMGPANEIVYITSPEQFIQTFGAPNLQYPWSSIYAYYWSQYANALVVRLLPYDATQSNIALAFVRSYTWQSTTSGTTLVPATDSNSNPLFTIAAGYANDSNSTFTILYSSNTAIIGMQQPYGNLISAKSDTNAFVYARFYGNGPYYNNINIQFNPSAYPYLINLGIYYNTTVLYTLSNASFEPNTNNLGIQTQINTNSLNNIVSYSFNQLYYNAVLQGQLAIGKYSIEYNTYSTSTNSVISVTAQPSNTLTINSMQTIYTLGTSQISLTGGSNGSLVQNGQFNYNVFSQLVIDAIYGNAQSTGSTTSYLASPIYSLLDETYPFIKYVFDPTDSERFAQTDQQQTQTALLDFAYSKWNANEGCLAIMNIAPINNPFSLQEITTKQFFNSHLAVAYGSLINGILYGTEMIWPQIAFVARDLVKLRAGQYSFQPFAGPLNAPHSDVINLPRKYSLGEKDQLVLYGINYAVQDVDYGIYTDLDRTTTATSTMLRWMYVVEDIIDLKYQVQKLLKQYLHQLQTYNWNSVQAQIEKTILDPRVNAGLLLDYKVNFIFDQTYLNQNILPVIIEVQYAMEIERFAVTIVVQ